MLPVFPHQEAAMSKEKDAITSLINSAFLKGGSIMTAFSTCAHAIAERWCVQSMFSEGTSKHETMLGKSNVPESSQDSFLLYASAML